MITLTNIKKIVDKSFQLGPLSLEVESGNIFALVGNNGAGKSTLFQVMMGLVKQDTGERKYGAHLLDEEWKREVAYVPQSPLIYHSFTLRQLASFYKDIYIGWSDDHFLRLIELFDLPVNKVFEKLSVGMQKKAMLVLALSRPSTLLLLDEPLAGVDIEGQEQIKDELVHYMERGDEQTIIFATHSADEVKTLADYIVLLKHGQLLGQYEKDSLLQKWERLWVRMNKEQANKVDGVIDVAGQGELIELITNDIDNTKGQLKRGNIKVEMAQGLELREILRYLLQK